MYPVTDPKAQGGGEGRGRGIDPIFLDLDTGRSAPRPGHYTPGKDPVSIVQETGWAPGPAWTCAKNLVPTRIFIRSLLLSQIQSPDLPAISQSLYQLSYPGPFI
jgi:hypothetical protein